jgi:hypothetical protein
MMPRRPEHHPEGDPCTRLRRDGTPCNVPASAHQGPRPDHIPDGDPCSRCGESARVHRGQREPRPRHTQRAPSPPRPRPSHSRAPRPPRNPNEDPIVAIDGEGQGRAPHLYTYLAAVDENGHVCGEARNSLGLSSKECLDFILNLRTKNARGDEIPVRRLFGFSLGYDLTKWLEDLADQTIFDLTRPDSRLLTLKDGRTLHRSVYARNYLLNYVRGKFTARRAVWDDTLHRPMGASHTVTVWDVFRFFQSKFTTALLDWQIRSGPELAGMVKMKDQRDEFEKLVREGRITKADIEAYCKDECLCLAELVRELIEAHENVGLRLRSFFGAGSTATALMKRFGVKECLAPPPAVMHPAVMCGFFGGRFEISRVGPVEETVYNYDISSAYPYQSTLLPCLVCGRWERITGRTLKSRIERARLALVRARIRKSEHAQAAWGPLPFRTEEGTIVFPRSLGSVWTWKEEFLAAERLFPGTEPIEAWVYETPCDHKPFGELPGCYVERLRIGKEARGLVLKLGMNSVYGKTAQSIGQAPFQSHVWAGVVTSNTRAQLLQALGAAKDPWSILMFATDGVFSREPLTLPKPIDTGTDIVIDGKRKPLGGWEEKKYPKGVFFMRPGVYFPLEPTKEQLKEVKARGMSKGVLLENVDLILDHWEKYGTSEKFEVKGLQRFVGMRTGVQDRKSNGIVRDKNYGDWIDYPVEVSLTPLPKRERVLPDYRLKMFDAMTGYSAMYNKIKRLSPEAAAHQEVEEILGEQADGDFSERLAD